MVAMGLWYGQVYVMTTNTGAFYFILRPIVVPFIHEGDVLHCVRQMVVTPDTNWFSDPPGLLTSCL